MSKIQDRLQAIILERRNNERILNNRMVKKGIRMGIATIGLLILWQIVAMLYFEPEMFPSPVVVMNEMLNIFEEGGPRGHSALFHLRQSLIRVLIATSIGMGLAILIGLSMGLNDMIETALSKWMPFWMTIPTVVIVLVSMVLLRFSETAVVVAVVFAATPYAAINTWKGMENLDPNLEGMAQSFKLSKSSIWRHLYLPTIMPSIFGALRYLVSISWKIVVLAEVFGMSDGLGAMFRYHYGLASVSSLLAYLVLFVIVMFIFEYGIIYPLDRYMFRWRN